MTAPARLSADSLAQMAPIALTQPETGDVVSVRAQTEHLYVVERYLRERGVPEERIEEHFLALHRCPPLPLQVWLAGLVDAQHRVVDEFAAGSVAGAGSAAGSVGQAPPPVS